jgi:phytoene desaturase
MSDYDVIVIGAGCGGLSAGSLLAKKGYKTLVLEQSSLVGGCCSTFEQEGFGFDLGASILEDVDVIDWCFERLGTSVFKETEMIKCDPIYTVILKDGTRMTYPLSSEETAKMIGKMSPEDEDGWRRYATYMKSFLDAALKGFFLSPGNTVTDMAVMFTRTPALLKYFPLFATNYQSVLEKFFKSDKIIESIAYQSYFFGLPPELGPGHSAMIPYSEHEGVYYTKGGMKGIPEALVRCGQRLGMEMRLNTLVKKVIVKEGRAVGVMLGDGTEITARLIVSNINAKQLYTDLIGLEHLPWLAQVGVKSYQYAMATPMIYLGVDYEPPLDSHHTIITLPVEETNRNWNEFYMKGFFPTEQYAIISYTSKTDPGLAPKGCNVIVLTLSPGPYKLEGKDWDEAKPEIMDRVIKFMEKKCIPDLTKHIKVASFATPKDFERRLLSPEGAIYALRQDLMSSMVFRPAAKSKNIKGLYLTGASTHPGGGVPTVIASGMIAADLIEKYEN